MKKFLVFLIFIALLSGFTYAKKDKVKDKNNEISTTVEVGEDNDTNETTVEVVEDNNTEEMSSGSQTVYLVVPSSVDNNDLYINIVYSGSGGAEEIADSDITSETISGSSYQGNSNLKLVKLTFDKKEAMKIVAGYKGDDDKYYYLVSPNADTDNVVDKFEDDGDTDPSEVFGWDSTKFTYTNYPGYNLKDNVRLSLYPVEDTGFKFTMGATGEEVEGETGISPNHNKSGEFSAKIYIDGELIDLPGDKHLKDMYDNGKIQLDKEYTATYLNFKTKSLNKCSSPLKVGNKYVGHNSTHELKGDVKVKFRCENSGNGQWYMTISGTANGTPGNTLVLLEDKGDIISSEVSVVTSVSKSNRMRKTNIETSLINSENFTIKNIKE